MSIGDVWYDEKEDTLGIRLRSRTYYRSVEVSESVIVDLSKDGEIIGMEILGVREAFKEAAPLVIAKTVAVSKRRT